MSITKTEIEVYSDASLTTQVGSTILTNSDATQITINDTALGGEDLIQCGTEYYARARAYNSEGFWSDWSEARKFTTLPYIDAFCGASNPSYCVFTIAGDLYTNSWGVKISPNADGSNAVQYMWNEYLQDESSEHKPLWGLDENTDYYYIPCCMDSLGRYIETVTWDYAPMFTTPYNAPYAVITNATATTDSITVTVDRQTNDPSIGKTYIRVGSQSVEVSDGVKGEGTYTVTNGDPVYGGGTLSILPNTQYTVTVMFYTDSDLATNEITITTQPEPYVSVEISIDSITSSQIRFYIDCETDDPNGLAYLELQYKKQGAANWTDFQVEVQTGSQGAFVILTQPNSTYQIYLYAEDDRGEHQDSQTVTVTTPSA